MRLPLHELSGPALNWMVGQAEGMSLFWTASWASPGSAEAPRKVCRIVTDTLPAFVTPYEPSTSWLDGAPILERIMKLGAELQQGGPNEGNQRCWLRLKFSPAHLYWGETVLEAVARCRLGMAYGGLIDVRTLPKELL